MRRAIMTTVIAVLVLGSVMASVSGANAVVCARGVYRAGCAGCYASPGLRSPCLSSTPGLRSVKSPMTRPIQACNCSEVFEVSHQFGSFG
jgi:hypothetical protein